MTINIHLPHSVQNLRPTITVIGVGGAGGNAVNNMIASNLEGVNFVVANTDAQSLEHSLCDKRIQLGSLMTQGLGAGASPDVGGAAAQESLDEIESYILGSHMLFVTAGMGGGTGTGAAPVIAKLARDHGILTVGVVTKPFHFEGAHRMRLADAGVTELQKYVDTLIIIPNQNLFRIANERTTFADAFKMADDVLHAGVRGITDLMIMPGLINLDFADIRTVMSEMGKAMMGTGEGEGDRRAIDAAEAAISNPLLDEISMKGARGVLINITGGPDLTLFEVDEAANRIREEVDPDANIIFGSTFNKDMTGKLRVSVVATGIESERNRYVPPVEEKKAAVAPAPKQSVFGTMPAVNAAMAAATKPVSSPVTQEVRAEPVMVAATEVNEAVNSEKRALEETALQNKQAEPAFVAPKPAEARVQPTYVRQGDKFYGEGRNERSGQKESGFNLFQKLGITKPAPQPQQQPRQEQKASDPRLETAGAPASGTAPRKQGDDDYLEVPAFLRRQAN